MWLCSLASRTTAHEDAATSTMVLDNNGSHYKAPSIIHQTHPTMSTVEEPKPEVPAIEGEEAAPVSDE